MEYSGNSYDLYKDIKERTDGQIYIGVLGPVRTGKSTFIKRFMEEIVLPNMEDTPARTRAQDEMPQSAGGKTITTTEPKFIPNEAADITLNGDTSVSVRLIDCVGYMVEGAAGHMEEDTERLVMTPWFEEPIPFTKAAEAGTDKVMNEHSTIGIVVTTDASFGEIPRANFIEAEERTIYTLQKLGKPFIVLLNSKKPYAEETKRLAKELTDKYAVPVLPVNCEQLRGEEIHEILERVLFEFPISRMEFYMPGWMEMLAPDSPLKTELIQNIRKMMGKYTTIREIKEMPLCVESSYIKQCVTEEVRPNDGLVKVVITPEEQCYYEMLSDMVGEPVTDEYDLVDKLHKLSQMQHEYEKVLKAVQLVRLKGYGVVTPDKEEITLQKPELIKHGNKYGVKISAVSPSIHMIRANIETEIAPIVGTKEQAEDLISYISRSGDTSDMWSTNIFGKTVEQLVNEGITAKVAVVGEESQIKLQDTMQKIVNESDGGMVCIIL